uniref:Thiolase N-terminal domain-containing protein n=1 Tax=Megaselia scalaris TaxID=36166 RepID=T1GWF5_MEGSC
NINQTQLQTVAAKAALEAANVQPEQVDTTVIGHVLSNSSTDGIYVPRHVALHCGVPIEKPALGVNRLCGSGFQSVVNGAQDIVMGTAKVALTGGVDNMSQAPYVARNLRFGTVLGTNPVMEDSLWAGLTDSYAKIPMALTAENLAEKFKIARETVDQFALKSQQNWKKGLDAGAFQAEITPLKIKVKGKEVDFVVDEHARPQTTLEGLAKLPSLFKKNGTVTAGTASGICDGAAAVVLASEAALKEYNLTPLARLVGYSYVGVQPEIMGIGPVPAIKNVLNATGLKLQDIDLVEINEAFGVQTLACAEALNLDMSKLNCNGVHELRRKNLKYAIGSACIGGGQGIAVLLERV